jgi:uncharacterized protein
VAPEEWRALSRCPSYYLTYDWMAVMAPTVGSDMHALLVRDDAGAPVAGIPYTAMTSAGSEVYDPLRMLVAAGREAAGGDGRMAMLADQLERCASACYPVVTSVAPGFTSGVCESPQLDAHGADAATDALLRELEREARSLRAGAVAFLYAPELADARLARLAAARDYRSVVLQARCVMNVVWPTFDDYVASRTKTRRKSIRAEIERFRAEFTVEIGGVEATDDELIPLHARWRAKYGRPVPEPMLRRQYAAIRERLGQEVRNVVARRDGRPAAFARFYEHEGTWYSRAIGFDYELVDGSFAYFNVLFYEPLREAMTRGIRALDYSYGSYEAKLGRGCTLQHFLLLLKPLSPMEPWFQEYLGLVDRSQRATFARLRELHP